MRCPRGRRILTTTNKQKVNIIKMGKNGRRGRDGKSFFWWHEKMSKLSGFRIFTQLFLSQQHSRQANRKYRCGFYAGFYAATHESTGNFFQSRFLLGTVQHHRSNLLTAPLSPSPILALAVPALLWDATVVVPLATGDG